MTTRKRTTRKGMRIRFEKFNASSIERRLVLLTRTEINALLVASVVAMARKPSAWLLKHHKITPQVAGRALRRAHAYLSGTVHGYDPRKRRDR